jgi:hypothetical protein
MQHVSRVLFGSLRTAIISGGGVLSCIAQLFGIMDSLSMRYLYTRYNYTNGVFEGNYCGNYEV